MAKRGAFEIKFIATWTARFARKAGKRLTKREAAKLARNHYETGRHYRTDHLALRTPGGFAKEWADRFSIALTFKSERRAPARPFAEGTARFGLETSRHLDVLFYWYGPSSGRHWPGEGCTVCGCRKAETAACASSYCAPEATCTKKAA